MSGREKTAEEWITEATEEDQVAQTYDRSSPLLEGYGMQVTGLTREQIQALLDGKVLLCDVLQEYGLLLYLKGE